MKLEIIADYACEVGENPLWHPIEKALYWCDIPTGRIFRYSPRTGKHEMVLRGEAVGGFTVQLDGGLLLFMARGCVKVWREGKLETIIAELEDERETRFNDVVADPLGGVFCGTMATAHRPGRLYRLSPSGSLTRLLEGIGCPNGLGFTLDKKHLYFTDSFAHTIYLFDFEKQHGQISNQRVFARIPENDGLPDGLTVDSMDYVWSARWDGSSIVRYSPEGKEVQSIAFPVKKISSLTFGGDDLTEMYITSAGGENKNSEGDSAGALFRVRQPIPGSLESLSAVGL